MAHVTNLTRKFFNFFLLNQSWYLKPSPGLSLRSVTRNTCYGWVCLIFPLCYGSLPVVDRIQPQSNKFAMGVVNKATGDSKLNDSPVYHPCYLIRVCYCFKKFISSSLWLTWWRNFTTQGITPLQVSCLDCCSRTLVSLLMLANMFYALQRLSTNESLSPWRAELFIEICHCFLRLLGNRTFQWCFFSLLPITPRTFIEVSRNDWGRVSFYQNHHEVVFFIIYHLFIMYCR